MSSLTSFLQEDFDTLREQWEKQLQAELKTDDVRSKTIKKLREGGEWATLSLEEGRVPQLHGDQEWKKAAQTYVCLPTTGLRQWVKEDLEAGVRSFFIESAFLKESQWAEIEGELNACKDVKDIEVFILGNSFPVKSKPQFNLIQGEGFLTGQKVHDLGGNSVQELAHLTKLLIEAQEKQLTTVYLGVYVDSQFFKNVAKLRAMRLLAQKVLQETASSMKVSLVALTSMREWTLYERYSNLLRNVASVASAYIGGADHAQSVGYQVLFDYEVSTLDSEHTERSRRMARNTAHILALESMLGVVQDPAFGSFHLDQLTERYAQEAWALMQKMLPLQGNEYEELLQTQTRSVREKRLEQVKTRKHIMAGMNDFPDRKDALKLPNTPTSRFFRVASCFEGLRLQMGKAPTRPRVEVAIFGDYAALNARINFVKNYFELLGLEVHEPGHSIKDLSSFKEELARHQAEIVVVCAADADYSVIQAELEGIKAKEKFVAGKVEVSGFQNLYVGQNVYDVLEGIVSRWGHR